MGDIPVYDRAQTGAPSANRRTYPYAWRPASKGHPYKNRDAPAAEEPTAQALVRLAGASDINRGQDAKAMNQE